MLHELVRRAEADRADVVRAWQDGDLVLLHTRHDDVVTTEFFDTEDGTHWTVTSPLRGPNPSGRTQLDGATRIDDLDRTEANKVLVEAMLRHCMFPDARPERIEDYFDEDYLQHNPNVGDGLHVVRKLAQSATRELTYSEIVLLVGHGNFVATLCKADWNGEALAQVDIVRIEDGRIVEHWDNYERVELSGESLRTASA